jgi:hypothetical protein
MDRKCSTHGEERNAYRILIVKKERKKGGKKDTVW